MAHPARGHGPCQPTHLDGVSYATDPPYCSAAIARAIQIPYGNGITARAGTQLTIVHRLGDSITVRTDHGYLLRIDGKDADAMGLDPHRRGPPSNPCRRSRGREPALGSPQELFRPRDSGQHRGVGLIYSCTPMTRDDGTQRVEVKMTLTAPGCGMGQVLKDDVERRSWGCLTWPKWTSSWFSTRPGIPP